MQNNSCPGDRSIHRIYPKNPGFYQKSRISPRNIEVETGFLGPDA
ncbi:hypothetical protein [Microcoleus sp. herbarium12]